MTKVRIELSDATARAAREAGLLTSQALERLLTDAIRRRQALEINLEFYGFNDQLSDEIYFSSLTSVSGEMVYL
jgi:hypothetical protein